MRIQLIAAGTRMPAWIADGFAEYSSRMPHECSLALKEIPLGKRSRGSQTSRAILEEGKKMLAAMNNDDVVVALDVAGSKLDTQQLSGRLDNWLQSGRNIAMLIGGPDGLAPECLQRADFSLSLSPMTLPHGLVRVLLAEQLYRAWSLLHNHPYHRA